MENDELGEKTVGVVSKVDCLPSGTDIIEKICMSRVNDIPLKEGFIVVRNRTPKEIEDNISRGELKMR
jgi:hypothetical protein